MSPATKKYSAVSCGIKGQDRRALVRNIAVIFGALGVAAFVIRCVTRITMGLRTWGHDDTAMCLTMVSLGSQGFQFSLTLV